MLSTEWLFTAVSHIPVVIKEQDKMQQQVEKLKEKVNDAADKIIWQVREDSADAVKILERYKNGMLKRVQKKLRKK